MVCGWWLSEVGRGRQKCSVFSRQCSGNRRVSEGFSGVAGRRCVPDLLDLRTSMLVCRSATACNLGRAVALMCRPSRALRTFGHRFRWLTHTGKGCGGPLGLNRRDGALSVAASRLRDGLWIAQSSGCHPRLFAGATTICAMDGNSGEFHYISRDCCRRQPFSRRVPDEFT